MGGVFCENTAFRSSWGALMLASCLELAFAITAPCVMAQGVFYVTGSCTSWSEMQCNTYRDWQARPLRTASMHRKYTNVLQKIAEFIVDASNKWCYHDIKMD